jgi:ketosteroid isomerase-like protein
MPVLPRPLLHLVLLLPAAAGAETLRAAEERFLHQAATDGLRPAFLAQIADDATIMFLHARGRPEIERATATRFAADAKFTAEPLLVEEAASHDLGYAWGRYRLEFTRKTTGEHVTSHGKFVDVWKNEGGAGWKLWLTNWAPEAGPDHSPAAVAAAVPPGGARSPQTLRQAEEHFLQQAGTEGIRPAFLAHLADDGTIMFLGAKGRAAVEQAVTNIPAGARITAQPAVIAEAASGELGYVWGAYRFAATVDGKPFQADGKFITIWRRQADGAWRIVLDHGTEDPAPAAKP